MRADLREWAQHDPERVAIQVGGVTMRYGELEARTNQLARLYACWGLRRGEHVAALLGNTPFMVVMAWAAWRSGLYFTPVSTALSAVDAAHIVADCQAQVVVVDSHYSSLAAGLRSGYRSDGVPGTLRWLTLGSGIEGFEALEPLLAQEATTPREDESPGGLMLYTSGTTGVPRGVWRRLLAPPYAGPPPFAADLLAIFGLNEATRYLSTAPLYHAAPLRFALAVTAAGGSVYALEKFDAESSLDMLQAQRITHSQWVPTMFQRLLQLPLERRLAFHASEHAVAIHAAAPCPPSVKQAMLAWWGPMLVEYYSGSEGVGMTLISSQEWLTHPGSVGRAVKGIPHVLDESGQPLETGQTGRIYFSGVPPFEYFGDPEKTAARTSPQGYQTLGDIGHVDQDGYLYLSDRLDDMIISGGVNVYPQEIESAILELPAVLDCGVVGVPDAQFGERPVAFVMGREGADAQGLMQSVTAHCKQRLGRIKQPARIIVVQQLPRTAAGKLLRRHLRGRLNEDSGADAEGLAHDKIL